MAAESYIYEFLIQLKTRIRLLILKKITVKSVLLFASFLDQSINMFL